MYLKILKLLLIGFFKPGWPFCFLFGTVLVMSLIGYFLQGFQEIILFVLSLQAVGIILISLDQIWKRSEAKQRLCTELANSLGGSVGPAFISLTNSIGVGFVLTALTIQISEILNWFIFVMLIFSLVVIILGVFTYVTTPRNKLRGFTALHF